MWKSSWWTRVRPTPRQPLRLSTERRSSTFNQPSSPLGALFNLGLAAATRDLVAIASAHVYPVYPDWLECLLEPFADPTVALTYGKQRGERELEVFREPDLHPLVPRPARSSPERTPFCNNANAAVRRSTWSMHPYDETLTGLEDLAWAKWARSRVAPSPTCRRQRSSTSMMKHPRGVYNRYRREGMAFKKIYPEAHFSLYDFVRMSTANISSDLWHAARQHLFISSFASILWFRAAQFWGTYQGYRHSLEWNWQLRQTFYFPHGRQAPEKPAPRSIEPIHYNE